MIPYAGHDRMEGKPGYYQDRPSLYIRNRLARRALVMFRAGLDTIAIAMKLDCTEQRALKLVTIARSQEKGLPLPYEARL